MRASLGLRLSLATVVVLWLTGCGAGYFNVPNGPAQTPPTTLNGNWFLAGSRVPATYPVVSTSLYVSGDTVTGQASFATQCNNGGPFASYAGGQLLIKGTIASDGTFQAGTGTVGDAQLGTIALSLMGSSPTPTGPATWQGTYTLVTTSGSNSGGCNLTQGGAFSASPIADVTGTYVGTPANPGGIPEPFGANASVSVQITQGSPTMVTRGGLSSYFIPLTANLTIANSPCAFSGSTTATTQISSLGGDSFDLAFAASGPLGGGYLGGTLDDDSANSFAGDLLSLAAANGCEGLAEYHFIRQ